MYLKKHRGIDLKNIPSDIRFHPNISAGKELSKYPALLAIGRNERGEIQRVQAIYLEKEMANKANLVVKKRSYAVAPGSSVNLSRNIKNKKVTYLAEGVETGLSILQSVDNGNVEVVLGKSNFKHPNLKNMEHHVVLCLDNDGNNHQEKDIHAAAIALINQGKTVWIAKPAEMGKDYNDLLKEGGQKRVRDNINQALLYKDFVEKPLTPSTTLKEELSKLKTKDTPIYSIISKDKFAEMSQIINKEVSLNSKIIDAYKLLKLSEGRILDKTEIHSTTLKNENKIDHTSYQSINTNTQIRELRQTEIAIDR